MFFSIIHYRKIRKIDELMSFLMWIYFITYNFLFFKKVLRQNTYLTAYSVTGGRFPRARASSSQAPAGSRVSGCSRWSRRLPLHMLKYFYLFLTSTDFGVEQKNDEIHNIGFRRF